MASNVKGKESWISVIVDVTTGGGFKWTKRHHEFEEHVRYAKRDGEFWYARWGIYNIIAAKEGTEVALKLRKMTKMLALSVGVKLKKGYGRLFVDPSLGMEEVWNGEFVNMMLVRNARTSEEVDRALNSTKEERGGVLQELQEVCHSHQHSGR